MQILSFLNDPYESADRRRPVNIKDKKRELTIEKIYGQLSFLCIIQIITTVDTIVLYMLDRGKNQTGCEIYSAGSVIS